MRKLTIKEMQSLAISWGGICLSREYIDNKTKLKWRCVKGHEWKARPSDIKKGHWCSICYYDSLKLTIEKMQELARSRGGLCLSTEYVNNQTKLKWQCKEGHIWETTPNIITNGHWCPTCNIDGQKATMRDVHLLALMRGDPNALCLSNAYLNCRTKLIWQCESGHVWWARPKDIKGGSWCPICSHENQKLTIEDMHLLALMKGGLCLSVEYKGSKNKLQWQCERGHLWETASCNIIAGKWCRTCCFDNLKLTIIEMQKIAKSRGGLCLSTEYVNNQTKLRWQCKDEHKWEATPSSIKQGTWCPYCYEFATEKDCRHIFESLFNKHFPMVTPRWLIDTNNHQLQLDGYNKELKIAFEYNGKQHYEVAYYNGYNYRTLYKIQMHDRVKKRLCKERDIILIVIPHWEKDYLEGFILKELKKRGVSIPITTLENFGIKRDVCESSVC